MKLTVLMDNKTENLWCRAEWGLSLLIETAGSKYLFDTGASSLSLDNAEKLGIDLSDVKACVLSHGHYDHTNGVEAFLEVNDKAPIYIHREGIHQFRGEEDGVIDDFNCGIMWSEAFIEKLKPRLVLTDHVVKLADNICLVGDIENLPGKKATEKFYKFEDGKLSIDPMNHEQFMVVEEEEGIHIITGCGHKGAETIIVRAKELFPDRKIISFTGGMHTYMLKEKERNELACSLKELGVSKVIPLHCTGMNMIMTFKEHFGDDAIIACTGDAFDL
ncbi:MAG: MBL fold metallo-hydrolase [Clostridia bacterium]|nr:MBL fold metallo-hydrolase [Clostridia bacterium]